MEVTETPELSAFYKMICNELKPKYCVVCLRNCMQRRLVKAVAFKKFCKLLSGGSIGYPWRKGEVLVCHLCERQASNALRFYNSAQLACNLHMFFNNMPKTKTKNYEFKDKEYTSELEKQLQITRSRTQFMETEILLIDCKGSKMNPTDPVETVNKYNSTSHNQQNTRETTSTDNILNSKLSNIPVIDAIIIEDDDDDDIPLTSLSKQKPSDNSTVNAMNPIVSNANPNQQFVIHPVMITNGFMSVPTLFQPSTIGLPPPLVVTGDNISHVLQKLVHKDVPITLPEPEAPVLVCVPAANNNVDNNTLNNTDSDSGMGSSIQTTPASEKAPLKRQNPMLEKLLSTKNDNIENQLKKTKLAIASKDKAKSDKIDWEDKIPMDVISFMDAVDPNAPSLVPPEEPPLGTITAVRSLFDGSVPSNRRRKHKRNQ